MRVVFLLVLMLVFLACLSLPLAAERGGLPPGAAPFGSLIAGDARPSDGPLPAPWDGAPQVIVRLPGADPAAPAGACGSQYAVRPGDTLGEVARACGVTLAQILSANPQISNPNRIAPGQVIAMPAPGARGGGDPLTTGLARGFSPGAALEIEAAGFAPHAAVRLGLGLSGSGFAPLGEAAADAAGVVRASVTIPAKARPGEEAFVLVTGAAPGSPSAPQTQSASAVFYIE